MMSAEDGVTADEAFSFLRDVLGVTSPESKMKTDREGLLQELISSWYHHIPFQSVRSISIPHNDRHLPSISEIKRDVFTKISGLCYHNNICCFLVLGAVGFDVSLVGSDIGLVDSHVLSIVHNLTSQGSKHMVDVGFGGYLTRSAIPLDFEKESPEYHDSFLRYKFVREGDMIIRLHNALTDPAGAGYFKDSIKDGWFPFVNIKFEKYVTISHFDNVMTKIHAVVLPVPPFLRSLRCMAFPNGRLVSIQDTTLLVESKEGPVEKTYLKSRNEILSAFARYFPQIPEDMITAAMDDKNVNLDFSKE